uniref:Uncharacterized protein n=1 Tax=Rangifer tarandus platyrhynchus TaxID=3082113 RepID=A0ACB0ETC8_RANTA|nr:unnamed protein product [Rangifer tarandus platyrhynchus]
MQRESNALSENRMDVARPGRLCASAACPRPQVQGGVRAAVSTGGPSDRSCGDRTLGDDPPDPEAAEELGQGSCPPPPRPLGALSTVGLLWPGWGRQFCLFSKCPVLVWVAGAGVRAQAGVSRGWGKCVASSRDSDGRGDSEAEPQPRGKAAQGSALGPAAKFGRHQRLPRGLSGVAVGQPGLVVSSRGGLRGQTAPWSLRPLVTGPSGGAHRPSQDTDSLGRFDGATGRDLPTTRSWGVGGFRDPPESKARRWESRSEDQSRRKGRARTQLHPRPKPALSCLPLLLVSDFCSETRLRERQTDPSGPDPDREPQKDGARQAEAGSPIPAPSEARARPVLWATHAKGKQELRQDTWKSTVWGNRHSALTWAQGSRGRERGSAPPPEAVHILKRPLAVRKYLWSLPYRMARGKHGGLGSANGSEVCGSKQGPGVAEQRRARSWGASTMLPETCPQPAPASAPGHASSLACSRKVSHLLPPRALWS